MYLGFPVTLGYMETITLKGGEPYTHRGIDLGSWLGDMLVIGGKVVAITGDTGKAEGPHTHVQAGRDEWAQNTIDPSPYIGKGGTVVKVGYASEWGNYFCLKTGDVNVFYCHLNSINVTVGQVIGENDMTHQQAIELAQRIGLLAMMPEKEITADWLEYHANNIEANPSYAAALAKQLYEDKRWQENVYKAVNYEKDIIAAKSSDEYVEAKVYIKK